ncbi:MAG: hypothetical protein ACLFQA_00285 [Bacteroidales bacterium]
MKLTKNELKQMALKHLILAANCMADVDDNQANEIHQVYVNLRNQDYEGEVWVDKNYYKILKPKL